MYSSKKQKIVSIEKMIFCYMHPLVTKVILAVLLKMVVVSSLGTFKSKISERACFQCAGWMCSMRSQGNMKFFTITVIHSLKHLRERSVWRELCIADSKCMLDVYQLFSAHLLSAHLLQNNCLSETVQQVLTQIFKCLSQ